MLQERPSHPSQSVPLPGAEVLVRARLTLPNSIAKMRQSFTALGTSNSSSAADTLSDVAENREGQMKIHAVLVVVLSFGMVVSQAQDEPKKDGKKDAPKRIDLLRFYDKNLHEHVYTYGEGEPAEWRKNTDMATETVIGQ